VNALALLLAGATALAAAAGERPVVQDDWPRALAVAKARGVPLVVDAWAPW